VKLKYKVSKVRALGLNLHNGIEYVLILENGEATHNGCVTRRNADFKNWVWDSSGDRREVRNQTRRTKRGAETDEGENDEKT
jgi:hypothetical protein